MASAEGVFCRRHIDDGVCAPMAVISQPVWSIGDGGSWRVRPPEQFIVPKPVFATDNEVVQFFVSNNADVNCGPTPQFLRSVFASAAMASRDHPVGYLSKELSYTDPDVPLDTGAVDEEYLDYVDWTVMNWPAGSSACGNIASIGPVRRRVGVCPAGFVPALTDASVYPRPLTATVVDDPDICFKKINFDPKNLGDCNGPHQVCGNPISPATGNKFQREVDISATPSGTLGLERYYNSAPIGFQTLGPQWRHSYDRTIVAERNASLHRVWAQRPDGKGLHFTMPASGAQWTSDPDVVDRLFQISDAVGNPNGWRYVTSVDNVEVYDASGKLLSVTNRVGLTQTLSYSNSSTADVPKAGLLLQVVDSYGRHIDFGYDAQGRLARVTDSLGQTYQYSYDTTGMLAVVTYPDATNRRYLYNEPTYTQNANQPRALTGIVDENGIRFATFAYDSDGRGISTEHAGGVDRYALSYQVIGSNPQTVVSDPLGTRRTYSYSSTYGTYFGAFRNTALTQSCVGCSNAPESRTYDTNGNVSAKTDFNARTTVYQYDLGRNLETLRVEANGYPQQRTITTQWHPTFRVPVQIVEPAPGGTKATIFTYDASGNLTQKATTAPKNDGTGATIGRAWQWTYGTLGRVLTATDPDGNRTTYTYYSDSDADLGKRGNVQAVTNAVGHTTIVAAYDGGARPVSTTGPNGLVTTMTYDLRGRLTSRRVGIEQTTYSYDAVGQLTRVGLPDGSFVQYAYDAAHRLTQISDSVGNRVAYTLDAIGNRVGERAYDQAGQLARTRSRNFDALNRLAANVGAQAQVTAYAYDNNSNRLTTTDPLSHATGIVYDALNRLTEILDPNLGVTKYTYDAASNLTQVSDPRNLATNYAYDGLNNLVQQVSPDTGTTKNTYDPAGNLVSRTDARGVTAAYTYDGINRATQVAYSNGANSEIHRFQFDVGTNAIGRLSQITDTSGFTNWTYNGQGRVNSKAQTVDTFTKTTSYGYNSAGQPTSTTTPSGQQIGYEYLNNRVAKITVNGQTLLQGVATTPFGPIAAWRWGNGLFEFRDYDQDGRLVTWEFRNGTSLLRKNLAFDVASRITAIADALNPTASQTYQYDVLDRLTVAQSGAPPAHTQQFAYDAIGNRLNVTLDTTVTNFAYSANSNRLQTLSGALPAGYLTGGGTWSFTYNNANRLTSVQSGAAVVATYHVNALAQRVRKDTGGVVTYFVYDEQGHLLGEYDQSGSLIQETLWLEDLPVATLRPTGTGNPTAIAIYYVHADHLGSPRVVTRPSDNAVVWQWDNLDPFGANPAIDNPSGLGVFKYALRFPGQYFDSETGTHYNYYRDYDPVIGRYEQSDPIGLRGGASTYSYVSNTPAKKRDPFGLWGFVPSGEPLGSGCGDEETDPYVPDNPMGFAFLPACRNHDKCYDTCPTTKEHCDSKFLYEMLRACMAAGGPQSCVNLAYFYYWAVKRNGQDAFDRAQKKCDQCFIGTTPISSDGPEPAPPTF